MDKEKTVIILGGGSGGLICANKIRKYLHEGHRVLLVDKKENHLFYPSLLWLLFDWRKQEQIERPLNILNKKGIEFIYGEVEKIDFIDMSVYAGNRKLNYDYLIISLGAQLNTSKIPKTDTIYNFYCLEGAMLAQKKINQFSEGRIAILISSSPFKCPAAPYETGFLLDYLFRKKGLRDRIDIQIFTPESLPMPTAGPIIGNTIKQMLEQKGIKFNHDLKLLSIDGKTDEIKFTDRTEKFNLLLIVPPHQAPEVVKDAGLTDPTGWIPADPKTLQTKYEKIYAIGDVTTIKLPNGKNLPKAGVFAHYQAEVVANNIASEIEGRGLKKQFSGKGYCFLEIGEEKAGFAGGNFYTSASPAMKMHKPGKIWHWTKILFEKWWLWHWF
ncbi:MAG: NAD(P)/FAD-dependent oxidoreductase [Actinobacteria bacterium]|nr:NAD(P)/FAD-dependent oxidoreductase [Actinomycetota bacterium]MCL5674754.1 NAD(P)/FAD-dependent oxidoreductase [Candidatus Omnitrophota bacterium]